jgi:Flp pilus assembly protein TadD
MPRRPVARSQSRAKPTAQIQHAAGQPATLGLARRLIRGPWPWVLVALAGALLLLLIAVYGRLVGESPARMQSRAEEAARSGDWATSLRYWRAINATKAAGSVTNLGEARACLALGRAAQAEHSLHQAVTAQPADPDPWRLLLEILRVEDRMLEAQRIGWRAYDQVRPEARRAVLLELTLSVLADLPDELVRTTLRRWVNADDADIDARIALLQRITAQPRAADPNRKSLLAELEALLAKHPDHIAAREVLVTALADTGEPERGHTLLDGWPELTRDARYWRLYGRWKLEYDHRPDLAVAAFRTVVVELPQDWRSWYRLARALRILGREDESREAAKTVSRIREALDPLVLGPRLDAAFDHLDDPLALRALAMLCDRAGLIRLAAAWRDEAQVAAQSPVSAAP